MLNTFYTSYCILTKVYSDKTFIKQAINSEPIEPINKNIVIKICYGVVEKDITLEYFLDKLCEKRPKLAVRILLKIAMYNVYFLNKAPYAVADNTVELAKKLGKQGVSGFINAILRKFFKIKDNIEFPKNETDYLSIKYSYPKFAVELLIKQYGRQTAEEIIKHDNVYTYIRFNNNINGEEYLQKANKQYEKTVFDNLFSVKNFNREDGFENGLYTFQSIGSVAICDVVENGENLIDCCAAPGGKSVTLSNKFKNIIACELHEHRANLIIEYVNRMCVRNVSVRNCDSTVFNSEFENAFDAVLCDSPCSGFGVVYENPDIKLNREQQNLKQLNEVQLKILQNCSKYLKKGGYLYYSTCSVFECENDCIVQKFLNKNVNFRACEIASPLTSLKTKFGLQFLPHISEGAGFYVCKLQKL